MNKARLFITIILAAAGIFVTIGDTHLPSAKGIDYEGFSAVRASKEIEIIASEPHSIYHPQERAKVKEYLASRLEDMGVSCEIFDYDSLQDKRGYVFNISNIYSVTEPVNKKADSYILLIAHYDSSPAKKVKGEKVVSYGAADDGYGVATILEILRNVLATRAEWSQGIKILFTDSEEYGLYGIKKALDYQRDIFEDVGLVINIEARGVKGPAILFETTSGNSRLIELYKNSSRPYAYSFTSAVYSILPNYTDFTLLKDTLPGLNFSVIDNLNYYHTNLDNFDNISLKSIQHYGDQILPLVSTFLTDQKYSDNNSLRSNENCVYFTIPFLGLFSFSQSMYLIIKIITSLVFLLLLMAYLKQSRISFKSIGLIMILNLFIIAVASAAGYLVASISAKANGLPYRLINLAYVEYEFVFTFATLLLFTVLYTITYIIIIRRRKISSLNFIASGNILMLTLSFVSYFKIGDSIIIFIPSFIAVVMFLLNIFNYSKYLNIFGVILLLMFVSPIIYSLSVTLAIGSLFVVTALWGLYLWLLLPLTDRFVRRNV
ncbi:MAG: M20/M25/M40 family metallo-hydrolase [Bacteroidales bacterium]|nr:M20/M25/M40 family metallo-hydrolase [Bacteroidales bacterium]